MSEKEKPLSELEAKIAQAYRINESVEDEQREIEVRLNKIEGLKPLLPNRKYGQKWEDLEYGISARSLIERSDAPLAGYLKISTGYWRRMEKAESARQAQIESMQKATEELQMKNAKQREIREFRQRNNLNIGTGYRNI
tara:strand:- start:217 stop:633 length:417 start_codon:yes stop_codon:yes gene_type:complete